MYTCMPVNQVKNWLQPLQVEVASDNSSVRIFASSRHKLDYLRSHYAPSLKKALTKIADRPVELILTLQDSGAAAGTRTATQATSSPTGGRAELLPEATSHNNKKTPKKSKLQNLNPHLTFDALVIDTFNRMAVLSGQHIASLDYDGRYNPMFIYGASGLGKTHTMHAIGNQFLANKPDSRVLYIHAEKFVSDVVNACRYSSFDEFKKKYHSLDLLLIDDVQAFSDKNKTIEEFFSAFEVLLANGGQVVLSSDIYPKEIDKIPERLLTRFVSGLTQALNPPPFEGRIAILHKKAAKDGIKLPDEVARYIAKHVTGNVRELEGALRNVVANATFSNQKVNIHQAKDALKDLVTAYDRQITLENIQKMVADFYGISIADLLSKSRKASVTKPRQVAMYISKELTQHSLNEIGKAFGGRDHTTVMHAKKKVSDDLETDSNLKTQVNALIQMVRN